VSTQRYYRKHFQIDLNFGLSFPTGCYIQQNRNECAQEAIEFQGSHLFFVDSDMEFPSDILIKLLHADKDIIGAIYNYKKLPPQTILETRTEDLPDCLCKSEAMPTGMLLIKTEVFNRIPKPWFACEPIEGTNQQIGEDVYFCRKARKYGIDIWLDPTIKVKHIGDYKY
jgi:hypothetical protein